MISQELVLYGTTLVNFFKKIYKFIHMKEGERQTYRKRERQTARQNERRFKLSSVFAYLYFLL